MIKMLTDKAPPPVHHHHHHPRNTHITTFNTHQKSGKILRREDRISLENLRLATELSDGELRKTLWSLVAFPKVNFVPVFLSFLLLLLIFLNQRLLCCPLLSSLVP